MEESLAGRQDRWCQCMYLEEQARTIAFTLVGRSASGEAVGGDASGRGYSKDKARLVVLEQASTTRRGSAGESLFKQARVAIARGGLLKGRTTPRSA